MLLIISQHDRMRSLIKIGIVIFVLVFNFRIFLLQQPTNGRSTHVDIIRSSVFWSTILFLVNQQTSMFAVLVWGDKRQHLSIVNYGMKDETH